MKTGSSRYSKLGNGGKTLVFTALVVVLMAIMVGINQIILDANSAVTFVGGIAW